jgi:hypothetical protein
MESVMRLMMILTGFVLAMLGLITFIHSDHQTLGVLILFGGVMSMFGGLPNHGTSS